MVKGVFMKGCQVMVGQRVMRDQGGCGIMVGQGA